MTEPLGERLAEAITFQGSVADSDGHTHQCIARQIGQTRHSGDSKAPGAVAAAQTSDEAVSGPFAEPVLHGLGELDRLLADGAVRVLVGVWVPQSSNG